MSREMGFSSASGGHADSTLRTQQGSTPTGGGTGSGPGEKEEGFSPYSPAHKDPFSQSRKIGFS